MLTLFSFVFMRSLGNAGMLVARSLRVLLAITLLPALLSIIGKGLIRPASLPAWYLLAGGGRFWHAWSRQVMRHPILYLVASMAVSAFRCPGGSRHEGGSAGDGQSVANQRFPDRA